MMKKLGELTVAEYMTRNVIAVDDTARLTSAIRLMIDERLTVLPVVDSQSAVIGMLSSSDLVEMMHEVQSDLSTLHYVSDKSREFLIQMLVEQGDNTLVSDVMTSPVETIPETVNLVMAARILNEKHYHQLAIVTEAGQPVGILTTSDFVRAVAELGAQIAG